MLFHQVVVDIFPICVVSELFYFFMKLLTDLVLNTWGWLSFYTITWRAKHIPVFVTCKNRKCDCMQSFVKIYCDKVTNLKV